jgi:hypothetical protein
MPDSDENLPLSQNDSQSTESRMRRALGLQGPSRQAPQQRADQARPRHRFVQDGGVPVVVLNSRSDNDATAPFKARVAELDAALDAERAAHGTTRRTLQEALNNIQALQTRMAHAELAHEEALTVERRARKEAEDNLQSHIAAEAVEPASESLAASPIPVVAKAKQTLRKAQRVPRAAKVKEAQPVKWWLPSFREKTR